MKLLPLLLGCALTAAWAADEAATNVPDPYGLGERLALISFLQEHGMRPAEGATLTQLRDIYRNKALPPVLSDGSTEEERAASDQRQRQQALRRTLTEKYHLEVPADATPEMLSEMRVQQEAKAQKEQLEELTKQIEKDQEEHVPVQHEAHTSSASGKKAGGSENFIPTYDRELEQRLKSAYASAPDILRGRDPSSGLLYFHRLCRNGSPEAVAYFLERDPSLACLIDRDKRSTGSLQCAVMVRTDRNAPDTIKKCALLVKAGANIDEQDELGNTPLILATILGCDSSVRALLDLGANPSLSNESGKLPLEFALQCSDKRVQEHLQAAMDRNKTKP